ncbi:hypothetical protein FA95DRAFT_336458 [Auriscalpium vulgare]|uniref:Uncharacterized protein n=1 Tax=Auriscalpium vulgare TaxID=40419 RepID=A0ACB8RIA9_9AGAM|nr:hypothetical protein FA95DRAFT_336458 [Auriscalpium vulgare]
MPNWHDPELLLKDHLAVIKLDHALGGLYLWEFVSTFDYEWSIITGKRSYSWTIYVYLVCRLSALAAWCVMFIGLDYSKRINCGAWESSFDGFAYLGLASASFIILLRNYAIWERNRYILAVSIGVWLVSIGLNIRGIIMSQSLWESVTSSCIEAHVQRSLANAIGILVSDIVLLVIMIVGLLRSRSASKDGLWRLLFSQGIIWLTLAGLVEVPPVVFMVLNLNDAWNLMFQPLEFIVLVIGATRMYRSLTDFDGDALLRYTLRLLIL